MLGSREGAYWKSGERRTAMSVLVYPSLSKFKGIKWERNVVRMGEKIGACQNLAKDSEGKRHSEDLGANGRITLKLF
jgi:hypothetical protein